MDCLLDWVSEILICKTNELNGAYVALTVWRTEIMPVEVLKVINSHDVGLAEYGCQVFKFESRMDSVPVKGHELTESDVV